MDIKKGDSLKIVFIEFFVYIIAAFMVIGVCAFALSIILIASKIITPQNYYEKQILKVYSEIQKGNELNTSLIPERVSYVWFDKENHVINSSIEMGEIDEIRKKLKAQVNNDGTYCYYHIEREDGVVTLRYQLKIFYRSEWMNRYLPNPNVIMLFIFIGGSVVAFVFITVRFSRKVENEMAHLIKAAEKIEEGNLEFQCSTSKIKEINKVIDSIEKMREGLKTSLKKQWDEEHKRREEIASLAHDIKTPLTVIKGNGELLQETELDFEQKAYSDFILKSTQEMENYVSVLIKTANQEGKAEDIKSEIKVSEIAEDLKKSAEAMCGNKVKYEFFYDSIQGEISGNREKISRAINNIILNGIQQTTKIDENREKKIYIRVSSEENYFKIEIIDSGEGFSEEDLIHGKEKLYCGDKSRTNNENHGMGLYIADTIIKDHGGEIKLGNSEHGGCVEINIPLI